MSHVVTHPAGSKIELVSYCSSKVPSYSAYVEICYVPFWLLVQWASCLTHELFWDHRKDCGGRLRHLHAHALLPIDAAWPRIVNGFLLF